MARKRRLGSDIRPIATIGDMDSLPKQIASNFSRQTIHKISDSDSTDFEKCLRYVDAPFIVGLGVLGPRLDHGLTAINSLIRHRHRKIVLLNESDACFLAPQEMRLRLPVGTRISLLPVKEVNGTSDGLKWPIDGLEFSPWGQNGTSNVTTKSIVSLSFREEGMLVVLPNFSFGEALHSLISATNWEPPEFDD